MYEYYNKSIKLSQVYLKKSRAHSSPDPSCARNPKTNSRRISKN